MRQEGVECMINLVWKDLLILKRILLIAPLYAFFGFFVFSIAMKGAALSFITILVTYTLLDRACDLDGRNNSEIILNSLPLCQRDIVLAKYLSVFLYAGIAIISFVFAQEVALVTRISFLRGFPISRISLEGLVGALVAMVIFISFYYPIYFKLGYGRVKWVAMMLVLSLLFFIPLGGSIIARGVGAVSNPIIGNIIVLIETLGNWIQTQANWKIASYMLALALILMSASVRLSMRFYARREF